MVWWFLFLVSLAAFAAALALSPPVPLLTLLLALTAFGALAGLIALVTLRRRRGPAPAPRWIVIDGSNVMHWKDGTPQIGTVLEVVERLEMLGFTPGVVFDANAGYKLGGNYRHHRAMARMLRLPEERVMVVDKGTPADATILLAARDLGARIVSNDQFRDWAETHPEVHAPEHLIKGGYRAGRLWLEVD